MSGVGALPACVQLFVGRGVLEGSDVRDDAGTFLHPHRPADGEMSCDWVRVWVSVWVRVRVCCKREMLRVRI